MNNGCGGRAGNGGSNPWRGGGSSGGHTRSGSICTTSTRSGCRGSIESTCRCGSAGGDVSYAGVVVDSGWRRRG
ncbi:hypothetical protein BDA96_05G043200 [Sorghum bicolor]|uniref:Uncharacterized protein n=2 Tax=Sorghum bicolor TaxID=4558 RepID=A0A921UEN6_SORBI|nr:hypothetical protein BDA96_05G043200 [Sorghum bicolor]OQU82898.1 hypothetical protein SORBI_3005G040950 [Sorghum bicolor]